MKPGNATEHNWLRTLRRYLVASAALHLGWETLQLPLYTIWSEPLAKQVFAVFHCTAGDLIIAGLTLLASLVVLGNHEWPRLGRRSVWLLALLLGVAYTAYSEWLNVHVRGNWAYSTHMPVLPFVGTGLAPILQWLLVPSLAMRIAVGSLGCRDEV